LENTVKFQVNKDVLSEAVSFAVRMLPQKNRQQILSGILIEADANALRLSVFDYEVSAQAEVVAKVEESGRILISSKLLSDISNRLPNAPVEFESDGTKLLLSCGSSKFTLPTMDVEAYPTLPELPAISGTISGESFAETVAQVGMAASKEELPAWMTGVMIEATPKTISFIATDRYRVALKEIEWQSNTDAEIGALVPAKTLQEIAKTFANQGEISIAIKADDERGMIAFKANNRSVTSQLIKEQMRPVRGYFPQDSQNYVVVSTQDLIDSTRRVALVLDKQPALKYSFEETQVVLEANESAQASESVGSELTGKDIVVMLKPQFLIDGLSACHSEFVKIAFTNNDNPHKPGPVLITSHGAKDKTDSYRYLLQPNLLR
jgi:DNA polymerase-3 subunit beta